MKGKAANACRITAWLLEASRASQHLGVELEFIATACHGFNELYEIGILNKTGSLLLTDHELLRFPICQAALGSLVWMLEILDV